MGCYRYFTSVILIITFIPLSIRRIVVGTSPRIAMNREECNKPKVASVIMVVCITNTIERETSLFYFMKTTKKVYVNFVFSLFS